jgi:tRNA dimethylallyltransferase
VNSPNPLLIVLGPTASGKTRLAIRLAERLGAEIISADSRQVFKGMDIGTGKDLDEYAINGKNIPHHLINIKEAGEKYNVNEFKEDFYTFFDELTEKGVLPILCGGTGMYIHSLLQNQEYTSIPNNHQLRETLSVVSIEHLRERLNTYPLEYTRHADLSSHKRLLRAVEVAEFLMHNRLEPVIRKEISATVIGLNPERSLRRANIMARLESRIQQGLIEEVANLRAKGLSDEMLTYYGLEYKFVGEYLQGAYGIDELKERLGTAICQFAKRQMTFFRKMEKDGVKIHWFNSDTDQNALYSNVLATLQNLAED